MSVHYLSVNQPFLSRDSRKIKASPYFNSSNEPNITISSDGFDGVGDMNAQVFSKALAGLAEPLQRLASSKPPSMLESVRSGKPTRLDERLYDATATVKIKMSNVAMHIGTEWRDKLFNQIDSLHDIKEWDEDDNPVNKDSFGAFIKELILLKPDNHPGLGLSFNGNVIAMWRKNNDKLIIEFLANGKAKWLVSHDVGGDVERASGISNLLRLPECIAPYNPERWFKK